MNRGSVCICICWIHSVMEPQRSHRSDLWSTFRDLLTWITERASGHFYVETCMILVQHTVCLFSSDHLGNMYQCSISGRVYRAVFIVQTSVTNLKTMKLVFHLVCWGKLTDLHIRAPRRHNRQQHIMWREEEEPNVDNWGESEVERKESHLLRLEMLTYIKCETRTGLTD